MSLPYSVYLGNRPLSDHATFGEALAKYRKYARCNGAHMRSSYCDVDHDGFTQGERDAIDGHTPNRTDLALGTHEVYWVETTGPEWQSHIAAEGRTVRRRARLDRESALRLQLMPIKLRLVGWRRYGKPQGCSFAEWSPWIRDYRGQLHLAVLRGSEFAARQLSQALVDDVRGAA